MGKEEWNLKLLNMSAKIRFSLFFPPFGEQEGEFSVEEVDDTDLL